MHMLWTKKGQGHTLKCTLATLPRFENTHNYDSYYYQQYNNGNAHPFSWVLLQFLSILKCSCPSLDMIDCVVDLNKSLINQKSNYICPVFHIHMHANTRLRVWEAQSELLKQICPILLTTKGSVLINEFLTCLMWILKESLRFKA